MIVSALRTHGPSGRARRSPRPALLFALAVAILVSMVPGGARAAIDAHVATDVLNLREAPDTDAAVIVEMYQGEYVAVIDGPTEDGWYYVDYVGLNGWAHGRYLSIGGDGGWTVDVGAFSGTAWVGTDVLNVRAAPSQDADIVDVLLQGSELALAGAPETGFQPILHGGGVAWVWAEYVTWDPVAAGPERWLDVDRSSSTVRMMEGDTPIATYVARLGWDDSDDGFYATALGTYRVYEKIGELTWTPYGRAYIKYWVGFDPSRLNGFHSYSLNKHGRTLEGGDALTGGCVATDLQSAKEIYHFATVGMRVEIHW